MTQAKRAILLLAHGTPETLDDIPEYLKNVTSGRSITARSSDQGFIYSGSSVSAMAARAAATFLSKRSSTSARDLAWKG